MSSHVSDVSCHNPGITPTYPYCFTAPNLLCFFQRPNVTRTLDDNLSVEIENLQGSPGISYIRFYNGNDQVFIPRGLLCFDLIASSLVEPARDLDMQPAFILSDASWYAFCNRDTVLAYIHATGAICLPSEVVCSFSLFSSIPISDFHT